MSAVVKKSEVRLTQELSSPSAACSVAAGAQARIVAEGPTEALIEVACTCGRKIRVRCTYARPAGPPG
jgi:hypothetical protein